MYVLYIFNIIYYIFLIYIHKVRERDVIKRNKTSKGLLGCLVNCKASA